MDPENGSPPYGIPSTSGKGECLNKPQCSTKPWKGPIPPGLYDAFVKDLTDPSLLWDIARNTKGDWGDWRIPLKPRIPLPGIKPARDEFFIHGGSIPGSAGCVDIGGGLLGSKLTDKLKKDLLSDPDGVVELLVVPGKDK